MIYYERIKMIDDIIAFAGRSFKKALTIDNKKLHSYDDFHCLKMWIKLKSNKTFLSLWNLANQWSIMHLYQVLNELLNSCYWESIFKSLIEDKTTSDIIIYCDPKIKDDIYAMIEKLIKNKGEKKPSLEKSLDKLKKAQQKPITAIDSKNEDKSNTVTNSQSDSEESSSRDSEN